MADITKTFGGSGDSSRIKAAIFSSEKDGTIAAAQLKQHMITNSLLSDLVRTQREQLKVDGQRLLLEKKMISLRKMQDQENKIEEQGGFKLGQRGGSSPGGSGRFNLPAVNLRNLGLLGLLFGPEILRRLQNQVLSSAPKFNQFDTRQATMGFNQMWKQDWNKTNIWRKGQIGRRGFDAGRTKAGGLIRNFGDDVTNFGQRLGTPFTGPRLPLGFRATRGLSDAKNFVSTGVTNTSNFWGGLTGKLSPAQLTNKSLLEGTSGLPRMGKFNLAEQLRLASNPAQRSGQNIRATVQGIPELLKSLPGKASTAIQGILKSMNNLLKSIKSINLNTITQFFTKGLSSFGNFLKGIGPALKNFSAKGLQGLGGLIKGAPGALSGGAATTSKVLSKTGGMIKNARAGLGKVPILGSLLSAGFGAMEANDEEMARLMAENNMSKEQVQAGLADGSLSKDKNKIISRSAGAGLGAGAGTVLGFAVAGPIGAALGAWLGENLGKFLGEGIGSVFKGFDWGETFRPVMNTWNEMTAGIGNALNSVAESFGIGGEGGSGGFITALKNIGRIIGIIAKILIKTLVPVLQMVFKTIQWTVQIIGKVVQAIVTVVKGMMSMVGKIIDWVPDWVPGAKQMKAMKNNLGEMASGDVIGNISNFVDNTNTAFPTQKGNEEREEATGQGGGAYGMGGGYGGDGTISASQMSPVLTSGFKTQHRPNHNGIDIGFKGDLGGQPMYLPDKAKITSNGFDAGYGNYVTFTTQDDNLTHLYGHMQSKSPLGVGKMFPAGEFVGNLGNTGTSSAPHLHWEVGSVEAHVGRGGTSLKDPRDFGYGLNDPFVKAASNITTSTSSSGQNIGSVSGTTTTNRNGQITAGTDSTQLLANQLANTTGTGTITTGGDTTGTGTGGGLTETPPVARGFVLDTASPVTDGGLVFTHA